MSYKKQNWTRKGVICLHENANPYHLCVQFWLCAWAWAQITNTSSVKEEKQTQFTFIKNCIEKRKLQTIMVLEMFKTCYLSQRYYSSKGIPESWLTSTWNTIPISVQTVAIDICGQVRGQSCPERKTFLSQGFSRQPFSLNNCAWQSFGRSDAI